MLSNFLQNLFQAVGGFVILLAIVYALMLGRTMVGIEAENNKLLRQQIQQLEEIQQMRSV